MVNSHRPRPLCFAFLCGLYIASGCRLHPQAFSYVGQVSWNSSTVISDGSSSTGTSCWVGNGTLLEVVTARAATCMTMSGCKAFTLESNFKGIRSCLLTSAPDVYIPSLDVSCYGVFSKVDGSVEAWGRQSTSPALIPSDVVGNVGSIYASGYNAYALLRAGYVVGWGDNDYQQLSVPKFDVYVTAVAAGRRHALALLEDGTVRAWGDNTFNQTTVPSNLSNVTAVAAGLAYSLALLGNGTVVAWGDRYSVRPALKANVAAIATYLVKDDGIALLRNGTVVTMEDDILLPEATQANVIAIACGYYHSLALMRNGTVVAWSHGYNQSVVPDAALSNVQAIAAGHNHSLALLRNGTVVAWGDNTWGQCDIVIPSGSTAAGIAGTERTSLILLTTGAIRGFGDNGTDVTQVVQSGVAAVSCDTSGPEKDTYCQVLHSNSTLVGWGTFDEGVPVLTNITTMSTAGGVSAAAFSNGTAVLNYFNDERGWIVLPIPSGSQVAKLAAGYDGVHALLANSTLVRIDVRASSFMSFSDPPKTGTSIFTSLITTPIVQSGVADISWGQHLMVLLSSGTVLVWEGEGLPFLDVPAAAKSGVMAISAGDVYHVALLGNGTLVAWEVGTTDLVNLPKDFRSGVVRVSTGRNHMLIQKTDGRILPWGPNNYKQATVPDAVANGQLQAFVCGDDVSFAILTPQSPPPTPPPTRIHPPTPTPAGPELTVPPPHTGSPPVAPLPKSIITNTTQPPPPSTPPSASQTSPSPSSSTATVIGAAIGAPAGVILLAGGVWLFVWRRRGQPRRDADDALLNIGSSTGPDGEEALVNVELGGKRQAEKPDQPASVTTASGSKVTPASGNSKTDEPSTDNPDPNSQFIYQAVVLKNLQLWWKDIKLGKAIGAGGFGTVYRARWRGDEVAVKMLNVAQLSEAYRAALRQEALSMVDLRHPRIVPVYGLIDDCEHCALVMKYFRCGALATAISNPEYSSLQKTVKLNIALQVAGGMQYLHDKDMLHGDLKTSNLLVDEARGVAITDFGLSCLDNQTVASGAMTVQISPPEVLLQPSAPRTKAGDVYAFGIVLFEIMAGKMAFAGMRRQMVRDVVIGGQRPGFADLDIADQVVDIIKACWAQEATARPSFKEVTARLEAARLYGFQEHDHNMDVVAIHTLTADSTTMPWAFADP